MWGGRWFFLFVGLLDERILEDGSLFERIPGRIGRQQKNATKLIDGRKQLEEWHTQTEAVNIEILVSFALTHLII